MFYTVFISFSIITLVCCKRYDILFIVVDDLRPALGIYNDSNAKSPNIDKFAKTSIIFQNAFAQQALCAPSRNSFLTSRRPDSLHLYDFYNYWRYTVGNFTTIPQYFKEHGYTTYSIGKIFHPGKSSNFSDDFPYSWSAKPFHPSTEQFKNAKVCVNNDATVGVNIVCPVRVQDQPGRTLPDIESMEEALTFLKKMNNQTQPFFLGLGFHKPHIPLKYPRHYLERHPINEIIVPIFNQKPAEMPNVAWNPWNDFRLRDDIKHINISYPFQSIPLKYTQEIIQSYAASVSYIDELIGRVLNATDLRNTIVIIVGDHGVAMGEHGEFSKYSNFDTTTRVPLILHIPNFSDNMIVYTPIVELVDIFPTLVDFARVSSSLKPCNAVKSKEICTEGKSLFNNLIHLRRNQSLAEAEENDFAISQYPRPGLFPSKKPDSDKPKLKEIKIMGYSIRTKHYRFTDWVEFNPSTCHANWSNVYASELYSHAFDSMETMNIVDRPELRSIVYNLRMKMMSRILNSY